MKRFLLPAFAAALALAAPAPAAQFTLGPHHFTLPDGFTIEVAAPSSLVPRPIEADFDEQGRLYVTDSSGSNDKVAKQLADKPHRILRLEDPDGDGVFDKSVVFADKMMFPEGALWHDGSLYVSTPPSIWKLTDTNNDGVADVREEWFKGQSLGGCANDLHGPYLGPDGWIYWCKGGFEKQTHTLGNGKTFTSRASHIWRARPDGTGLEAIMTGGMDNPVGLAWSPEGELFLSGTFFQHPGGGRRDGLIHVIYGGVYGKDHDVLDGHPRTGELLPIMTHLGPAAPCGMARYESAVFGADCQNNLFVCNFNLHKITRHVLKESGSTFTTADSDFLVSDNTDFHPTDVFEDADGSLLVIDTGGWYKLCCPTSQLQKPDVLGAIYRIRRKDAPKVNDPRGLALAWDGMESADLVKLIEDRRPAVSHRVMREISQRKVDVVSLLAAASSGSPDTRRNAVWALTRIDTRLAREVVRAAFWGSDESVRRAVVHSISLWRDSNAAPRLLNLLREPDAQIRRVAAEALGRIGDHSFVPGLLSVFADYGPQDRAHEHSLEFALIKLGDPGAVRSQLVSDNIFVRRAALIALDQMPGGNLQPEQVTPLLASENALLKQTASWIISHHPEWGDALAQRFDDRLHTPGLSNEEEDELVGQLVSFASNARVQQLCAEPLFWVGAGSDFRETNFRRDLCLRAMNGARLRQTPEHWVNALETFLQYGHLRRLRMNDVIPVVRNLSLTAEQRSRLFPQLTRIAASTNYVAEDRLEAAATCQGAMLDQDLFNFAKAQLSAANFSARTVAALALTKASLTEQQLLELAAAAEDAGPLETPKLLPAFARATNENVGLALVASLGASKSFRSLRAEQVRPNLTNFPATVRARADELLATLNTDAAEQKARLDELSLNLKSGDVRRGQAIFNSQKAACATCHAIGYLGGNLGPDLTRIGQIRTERDLLEAVVFPSASFVRSFEPMLVVTKSGDEHSGILRRDAPDEVVLATGPNAEVRLARADIAEMRPGTASVMPQGLDEQLTRQELADLIAFLKATKW